MWSIGRSDPAADLPLPVEIRTIRHARRMRLRYDDVRGLLKLTCPPLTSRKRALRWVAEQREWIDTQIARAGAPEPFVPGATIPLEGRDIVLIASPGPRSGRLVGDRLELGGPPAGFERRTERFLRRRALAVLSAEVAEFARAAQVTAGGVTIGDAASRWGSCSSSGKIRLNWRLIMARPDVRRYVVAHEVAHLRHLDHSPAFKSLEAELVGPGIGQAKEGLRRDGPRLRRLGRGS